MAMQDSADRPVMAVAPNNHHKFNVGLNYVDRHLKTVGIGRVGKLCKKKGVMHDDVNGPIFIDLSMALAAKLTWSGIRKGDVQLQLGDTFQHTSFYSVKQNLNSKWEADGLEYVPSHLFAEATQKLDTSGKNHVSPSHAGTSHKPVLNTVCIGDYNDDFGEYRVVDQITGTPEKHNPVDTRPVTVTLPANGLSDRPFVQPSTDAVQLVMSPIHNNTHTAQILSVGRKVGLLPGPGPLERERNHTGTGRITYAGPQCSLLQDDLNKEYVFVFNKVMRSSDNNPDAIVRMGWNCEYEGKSESKFVRKHSLYTKYTAVWVKRVSSSQSTDTSVPPPQVTAASFQQQQSSPQQKQQQQQPLHKQQPATSFDHPPPVPAAVKHVNPKFTRVNFYSQPTADVPDKEPGVACPSFRPPISPVRRRVDRSPDRGYSNRTFPSKGGESSRRRNEYPSRGRNDFSRNRSDSFGGRGSVRARLGTRRQSYRRRDWTPSPDRSRSSNRPSKSSRRSRSREADKTKKPQRRGRYEHLRDDRSTPRRESSSSSSTSSSSASSDSSSEEDHERTKPQNAERRDAARSQDDCRSVLKRKQDNGDESGKTVDGAGRVVKRTKSVTGEESKSTDAETEFVIVDEADSSSVGHEDDGSASDGSDDSDGSSCPGSSCSCRRCDKCDKDVDDGDHSHHHHEHDEQDNQEKQTEPASVSPPKASEISSVPNASSAVKPASAGKSDGVDKPAEAVQPTVVPQNSADAVKSVESDKPVVVTKPADAKKGAARVMIPPVESPMDVCANATIDYEEDMDLRMDINSDEENQILGSIGHGNEDEQMQVVDEQHNP